MAGRLTDQAVVAVALAHAVADGLEPTVAHLLAGLAAEAEGRAGFRLRQRSSAAALLHNQARTAPAPPIDHAIAAAVQAAGRCAATSVDLLDAAIAVGGDDVADLLAAAGYQRDLDGWLVTSPTEDWFEHPETYGFQPDGDTTFDAAASRLIAQVRAVDGGAVQIIIAAAAAPDAGIVATDPAVLASTAQRLGTTGDRWDAGLEPVIEAAQTLREGAAVTVRDLVQGALVAGGDGPKLVLELANRGS